MSEHVILKVTGTGPVGKTIMVPQMKIGTVTTVAADAGADASVSQEGNEVKLDLQIPRGVTGNESIDDTKGEGDTDYVWSAGKSWREKEKIHDVLNIVEARLSTNFIDSTPYNGKTIGELFDNSGTVTIPLKDVSLSNSTNYTARIVLSDGTTVGSSYNDASAKALDKEGTVLKTFPAASSYTSMSSDADKVVALRFSISSSIISGYTSATLKYLWFGLYTDKDDIDEFSYSVKSQRLDTYDVVFDNFSLFQDIITDDPTFKAQGVDTTINSYSHRQIDVTTASNGHGFGVQATLTQGHKYLGWLVTKSPLLMRMYIMKNGSWQEYTIMTYYSGVGYIGTLEVTSDSNDGYMYFICTDSFSNVFEVYLFDITDMSDFAIKRLQGLDGYTYEGKIIQLAPPFTSFFNKELTFFGDSNTQNNKYERYVAAELGLKSYNNCGVSGSNVAGNNNDSFWKDTRINALPETSDMIAIMGGTNDSHNSRPIGDMNLENYDTTTFVGAYNVVLSKIYYRFRKPESGYYPNVDYSGVTQIATAKDPFIILFTPPFTSSVDYINDGKIMEIVNAVKGVAEMWGLPCADVYGNALINMGNESLYFTDGVHVNDAGGRKIASVMTNKMIEIAPH